MYTRLAHAAFCVLWVLCIARAASGAASMHDGVTVSVTFTGTKLGVRFRTAPGPVFEVVSGDGAGLHPEDRLLLLNGCTVERHFSASCGSVATDAHPFAHADSPAAFNTKSLGALLRWLPRPLEATFVRTPRPVRMEHLWWPGVHATGDGWATARGVATRHVGDHWRAQGLQGPLSAGPSIVLMKGFVSDREADHLIAAAKRHRDFNASKAFNSVYFTYGQERQDAVLRRVEERISRVTGSPAHPDEEAMCVHRILPSTSPYNMKDFHHDKVNKPYTSVTVLVYLSDVEIGGGTAFPCIGPGAQVGSEGEGEGAGPVLPTGAATHKLAVEAAQAAASMQPHVGYSVHTDGSAETSTELEARTNTWQAQSQALFGDQSPSQVPAAPVCQQAYESGLRWFDGKRTVMDGAVQVWNRATMCAVYGLGNHAVWFCLFLCLVSVCRHSVFLPVCLSARGTEPYPAAVSPAEGAVSRSVRTEQHRGSPTHCRLER